MNEYFAAFLHDIRWGETLNPTTVRSEATSESSPTRTSSTPLPLCLETTVGHAYTWKRDFLPCHDEGIDFSQVIAAHDWFVKHQSLPSFDHSQIRWKMSSRPWLGLLPSPPLAGEWHLYVDGSVRNRHGGSACILFFFDGFTWTYGGWIGWHSHDCADSYQMELRALLLAAKWTLDNLKYRPLGPQPNLRILFHFDCAAAGLGALGQFGSKRELPELHLVRACLQMLRTGYAVTPEGHHHHSHQGQVGNEMVDDAANACALFRQADDDFWNGAIQTLEPTQSDWFWLLYRVDLLDKWKGGSLCIPRASAFVDKDVIHDALPQAMATGEQVQAEWNLQVATYNPMSLKGQGRRERDLSLFETTLGQFEALGTHVVALQETRIRRPNLFSPHYHLLMAPADATGNGGMTLGVSKKHLLGKVQGKSVYARDGDLKLIYQDPNLLVAKLATPLWTLVLINAHAPHSGHEDNVLEEWWKHLELIVTPHALHHEILFLGDVNGRIGQNPSEAVGELAPDPETLNGRLFHQFMTRMHQWCPATFAQCHQGRTATWVSPTGRENRIDFIALPLTWRSFEVASRGLEQVIARDFLHDHSAIKVEITASTWVPRLKPTKKYAPKRKTLDKGDNEQLHAIFSQLTPIDWNKDVHRHALELHTQIKEGIEKGFSDRKKFALKSFIQQDTWLLIQQKQELRRRFFELGRQSKLCRLRGAFAAWAHRLSGREEYPAVQEYNVRMALNCYQFGRISSQVKYLIKRDEGDFFENLTNSISEADRPDTQRLFWNRIRRLLPRFATRRQQLRSDKLVHLHGKWAPYLCDLEAGEVVDFEALYSQCVERHNQQEGEVSSLAFVPSLREVENRLRGIRADRCGGPDGVDPSWLSRGCIAIAPAVFDLIFKCLVWRTEPIQFKGGRLTMLPKGGNLRDPSNFRGIMLASSISKCIHAHLREPLIQTLCPLRPPGQLGGYPSKECSFAAQYVRSLTSICQHLKISCAVIYIDLKAAFHSLVRQLVTGPLHEVPREWQTLRTTLEKEGTLPGVEAWLAEGGCLQRLEAHPALIALMQELSQNAWAHLDSTTVRTSRGSRPGSPLADVTFHAAMLDVGWQLERVNEELIPEVPVLTQMGVQPHVLIWADDLAFPVLSQSAEDLEDKVQTAFLAIQRAFHSRGFKLNYSAGKTEIVPTWVGMGAPEQRRRMLMMEEPCFTFHTARGYPGTSTSPLPTSGSSTGDRRWDGKRIAYPCWHGMGYFQATSEDPSLQPQIPAEDAPSIAGNPSVHKAVLCSGQLAPTFT